MNRAIFVIGDVHGCYHTLVDLVAKLPKNSRLIFVGDLCDRGLYTKEVIDFIIENNYEVILGNHDDYMVSHILESIDNEDRYIRWKDEDYMGGAQTLLSYKNDIKHIEKHLEFLESLPRYIEIGNYFITHGFALPYYKNRDKQSAHIGLLKNRIDDKEDWGDDWEKNWQDYDVINIFGHTDYKEVEIGKNYYGIDTGCVYGGKLSAIELDKMNIISVALNKKDIST
ncbi:metallophosphoesterase [Sulfurimonas sp.]|uniref:metallophosphoesterase n=1 Tax=Sulfurimonas sp. TaxID=2022749 RepID=UPI0025DACD8F|nr:metallophosphoesterase [Sulfurimonas sp.]